MARAALPVKKETAAEKRTRLALEAAGASDGTPARRGEPDEPQEEETGAPKEAETQSTAAVPEQQVRTGVVVTGQEEQNPFTYVAPAEGVTDLERLGHAQRGIVRAWRGLEQGLGELERDSVLVLGEYFRDVRESKSYRAAGYKSVEQFVERLGIPGLTRKDYYRIVEAYEVFRAIGDMIDAPLNRRTIRELAPAVRKGTEFAREVFAEMKRAGRVNGGGAIAFRRLLAAGDIAEIAVDEKTPEAEPKPVDRLNSLRKAGKLPDLDLLKQVAQTDPDSAKKYVNEQREWLKEAERLLE